jgi:hypothetical protein
VAPRHHLLQGVEREGGDGVAGVHGVSEYIALCLVLPHPTPAPNAIIRPRVPVPTGASRFVRKLAAAREARMQAQEEVKRAMEEREAQDPVGAAALDGEAWRRGLLAADRNGWLRRALRTARQAGALASDRQEASLAAELLVMLECEAGHHREELRQAQRLVVLQHGNRDSLTVLLRAARCNKREPLAQQVSAELDEGGR